jgi:hypothetical protein
MNSEHAFLRWLLRAAVFFACCFGTAILMRQLMADYDSVVTLPFALLALVGSGTLSWYVVRHWRFVSPLRCACELGICGGIAGLGLYVLFLYATAYLLTPRSGGLQAPFATGAPNKAMLVPR